VWHCFGCSAGGNALDLWRAVMRQPLHAAVIDLSTRLGREVPWLRRAPTKEKKAMPGTRRSQAERAGELGADLRHLGRAQPRVLQETQRLGPGSRYVPVRHGSRPQSLGLAPGAARLDQAEDRTMRLCPEAALASSWMLTSPLHGA